MKSKKNKAKKTSILVSIAGLSLILGGIYTINNGRNVEKEDTNEVYYEVKDDKYINNSKELNADKNFEGLKVEDIEFFYDASLNVTNISFNAVNRSSKTFTEEDVLLSFLNKKGDIINTMFAFIPNIEKNESEKIYGTISGNIVDAYDMKIESWQD